MHEKAISIGLSIISQNFNLNILKILGFNVVFYDISNTNELYSTLNY